MPADYSKMKVAELKEALQAKGLPASGNKADLIERLQTSEAIAEDDILDQDDSMTEEAIKQAEEELKSQSPTKLKRTQIASPNKTESKPAENGKGKENEPAAKKTETSASKDDMAEKIKSRAERFGGFQSDDAKKAARAAKFGDMLGKQGTAGKISSAGTDVDVDLLKKRADRFGTATSTALKKAEVSEAIKRRQERFGVITADEPKPKKVTLNSGINSVVMDEKMKARMERFKMEVKAKKTKKMASALGNLMANYTDSEGEEMAEGGSEGEGEGNPSLADRLSRLEAPTNATGTPHSSASATSNKSTPVKKAALVSYHDPDAGLSDEERSPVPMDLESDAEAEGEGEGNGEDAEAEALIEAETEKIRIMEELWQEGVKLPPEPPGHCSKELQEKIEAAWKNKVERGADYNRIIQGKKAFRNPSIYEKLIIHCNIDELGTNFPPHLYDGHLFGKESFYEELAKVQKTEMDKREKALEAKKKLGESAKSLSSAQRKSKWDIQGMSRAGSGTGSAGTVISAFGSLNKKK